MKNHNLKSPARRYRADRTLDSFQPGLSFWRCLLKSRNYVNKPGWCVQPSFKKNAAVEKLSILMQ
ncbi:MAG: hypothetical protein EAZ73_30145 [Oscillatoriales cyanobacterium]|nr:MAG: hypothetical protein EAZ83_30410 [Oscillatoriales cyanobacterium]TAF13675.1 MAG: hypothetical protein EAZ73_30145 [Oscillatoriales cyanobacterium]